MHLFMLTLLAILSCGLALCSPAQSILHTNAQKVNLWRLQQLNSSPEGGAKPEVFADTAAFPQYTFIQPLDHFQDTGFIFSQRYWVSDAYYKPGGPVIVLDSGEDSGTDRLVYMQQGIVDILTNATNGLGIVLEHRYYGQSIPVLNFTTDSLRWLNNAQALADSANFMANVQIPGTSANLTAPNTPWIYYGGSYAGARSAHMRVLYPELVYGAIASSGVTYATVSDWQYYDIIRQFAPGACVQQLETAVQEFDHLIAFSNTTRQAIKTLYGLPNVTHDADVASLLSEMLGAWQDKNWDPTVNSDAFDEFCTALGSSSNIQISIAPGIRVSNATINYADFVKQKFASRCPSSQTQDDCFGTFDPTAYQATDLSQTWRTWQFQVCTQWGFFATAPPAGLPRIVSSTQTVDYVSLICKFAFPPGEQFTVPSEPDVTSVNALGGLNIAADRLAIIDGQFDPWRPSTPHADIAKKRPDTTIRPFKLLSQAVHHYDENGLVDHTQEPDVIKTIHSQEVEFIKAWLADFKSAQQDRLS